MVFVAYITSGRAKYEFETQFIGLFNDKNVAEREIKKALILQGKILSFYLYYADDYADNFPEEYSFLKEFDNFENRLKKIEDIKDVSDSYRNNYFIEEFLDEMVNCNMTLEYMINTYDDGHYEEGWNYTIIETDVI